MGTVNISEKLKDRTVLRIEKYRSRMHSNANKEFLQNLPPHGYMIYDQLVGENFLQWVKIGPKGMFTFRDSLRIAGVGETSVSIEIPLGEKRPVPVDKLHFESGTLDSGYRAANVSLDPNHPNWEHLSGPLVTWTERREKASREETKLKQVVTRLFREFKTLGPCLRAWPALWELIQWEDQQRQGARPKGMIGHVNGFTYEEMRELTGIVAKIKLMGV